MTDETSVARFGVPAGLRLGGQEMLLFAKLSDGRIHSRRALIETLYPRLWDAPEGADNVVRVVLCHLRAKLAPHGIGITRNERIGARLYEIQTEQAA